MKNTTQTSTLCFLLQLNSNCLKLFRLHIETQRANAFIDDISNKILRRHP